jgi:hypothetical protein
MDLLIPKVRWSHFQPVKLSIFLSTSKHIIQQIFILKGGDEVDKD